MSMLRRLALALLALVVATGAQAQTYRPGYAPGFRSGLQFLSALPTYPAGPTPLVLPAAAGTPLALYSVARTPGYNGPSVRVRRVSDGAEQDIGWDANGYVDTSAATSFANGSALKIPAYYDQSGNGRHATQTTLAAMPDFTIDSDFGGIRPVTFAGITTGSGNAQFLNIPASISLTRNAMSTFLAVNPMVSRQGNAFIEFSSGATRQFSLFGNAGFGGLVIQDGGSGVTTSLMPRSQPNVIGVVSSASAQTLYAQGKTEAKAAASSTVMTTGGTLGQSIGGQALNARTDMFGVAIYGTALSATDANAVVAALNTAYAMPTSFTARVILEGDSILEGWLITGNPQTVGSLKNWVRQMTGLHGVPEIFNLGVGGQTSTGVVGAFSSRALPLVNGTSLPVVVGFEAGTNDLSGASSSTSVKNAAGDYVKALRAAKPAAKIIFQTMLPRGGGSVYYGEYNTYIRGKTLTATDGSTYTIEGVVDVAADPTVGPQSATSNTALYVDGIHTSVYADSIIAPLWAAGLNAQLP